MTSRMQHTISELLPPNLQLVDTPERIAVLWSSYGYIYRFRAQDDSGSAAISLILKTIHPPQQSHPSESHMRKLLSYQIERWFYTHLSPKLIPSTCKLARAYPSRDAEGTLILEDLAPEFPYPARGSLGLEATQCVLQWLAAFHGAYWGVHHTVALVPPPSQADPEARYEGVWAQGTYWYLDTRREELAQTDEDEYGWLVPWIEKVNEAVKRQAQVYGTLVHGDVKGANIVFSHQPWTRPEQLTNLRCALYDLQYVGVGLPTHDLVYFLGTTASSKLLRTRESEEKLLRDYYDALLSAISESGATSDVAGYSWELFLRHWELSVVDWCRFMAGWGFWGNDDWVQRRAEEIVASWSHQGWPFDE